MNNETKKKDQSTGVTIYCAVYNHEKYLREALEGFLMQKTDFSFEVIIHDDASTDRSAKIIREYAERYPAIFKPILQTENQWALNVDIFRTYILPVVQGKYIAFCEGDDYWTAPDKLQKQYDYLESHPDHSACIHNTIWLDMNNGEERPFNDITEDCSLGPKEIILGWGKYHTSAMFARSGIFLSCAEKLYKGEYGNGDFTFYTYMSVTGKIRYLAETMSVYRFCSGADSWTVSLKRDPDYAEKYKDLKRKEIRMLSEVDKLSEHKYHRIIEKAIADRYFITRDQKFDRGFLKDKYMRMKFKELGISDKIAVFGVNYLPGLHRIYRKLKTGDT